MIILKIAFRNLWEHQGKTLIVGILIALGSLILVAGNSFLDSITAGMRQSFVANYTGDLIVHGVSESQFSLMPGPGMQSGLPLVDKYPQLRQHLDSLSDSVISMPLLGGMATVAVDEASVGFTMLWGVNFSEYRQMFPDNLELIAGNWPAETASQIMLSERVHREAERTAKHKIGVGDKILLAGMGDFGTKIREVTVAGIFRFKRGGDVLDRISLCDPDTLRGLKSLNLPVENQNNTMADGSGHLSDAQTPDLTAKPIDESALFGGDTLSTTTVLGSPVLSDFDSVLGDTSVRQKYGKSDSNAWNYVLISLKNPDQAGAVAASLQSFIAQSGAELEVSDWRWGAGMQAELAFYLQLVFNIIVVIIVIVAVIIIMNTLVISITERIPEIGTMRAMGAKKGFVRSMIMSETLVVSLIFGLAGMLLGIGLIGLLNLTGIQASGQLLESLFGGSSLHPVVSGSAIVNALLAVIVIGLGSCLYPIAIALKIQPVRAMQR